MGLKKSIVFFILFSTASAGLWFFPSPLTVGHNFIIINILLLWTLLWGFGAFKSFSRPEETGNPPRMMNIELLRFLFMLEIIWYHSAPKFGIFTQSYLGVEFFFILSGFFFTLTYKKDRKIIDFIKSKFIRFLPLMIFGSLICCLFEEKISISKLLSSFLFLHSTGLADKHCYLYPSWYLAVLFWVLTFFFQLRKSKTENAFFLIAGVLSFFAYLIWATQKYTFDPIMQTYMLPNGMIRGIGGVGLGILTAEAYKKFKTVAIKHKKLYDIFEFFIFFYAFGSMLVRKLFPDFQILIILTFSLLIIIFAGQKGLISNIFNSKKIFVFSKYTFSTYMVHCFFAERLLPELIKKNPLITEHGTTALILVFLGSVLLGIFAHHAVEKPGAAIMKKWLNG